MCVFLFRKNGVCKVEGDGYELQDQTVFKNRSTNSEVKWTIEKPGLKNSEYVYHRDLQSEPSRGVISSNDVRVAVFERQS